MASIIRAAARPCAAPSFAGRLPSLLSCQPLSVFGGGGLPGCDAEGSVDCALQQQRRQRHSQTQVKRLMKKHPARLRVMEREGVAAKQVPLPKRQYPRVFRPKKILSNGWSAPPSEDDDFVMPDYPFHVSRTKGKPNGAAGFLPVYSKVSKHNTKHTTTIRKISGDNDAFLRELRAVLKLPEGTDDAIRVRTGGNIEINGNRVRDVKKWLAELGF